MPLNPVLIIAFIFILFLVSFVLGLNWYIRKQSATISRLSELVSCMSGSRWLYLADFNSNRFSRQQPASEYSKLVSSAKTVFHLFCPKQRGLFPANKSVRSWSQQKVQSAVISSGPFQRTHLMPFSDTCNRTYRPLFEPMIKSSSPYSREKMLDFMFYGFRMNDTIVTMIKLLILDLCIIGSIFLV
jgi:hypothetical protein